MLVRVSANLPLLPVGTLQLQHQLHRQRDQIVPHATSLNRVVCSTTTTFLLRTCSSLFVECLLLRCALELISDLIYVHYNYCSASANNLSCGSNSVDFVRVTGFTVYDANSYPCNCGGTGGGSACTGAPGQINCEGKPHGTIFGACRGNDDLVDVQFSVEVNVKPEFNVGLYVNTLGGDAVTGTDGCTIAGLTERDASGNLYRNPSNQVLISHMDSNTCLDFAATGTLLNYPFQRMTLKCADTTADRLLDFSIAASFAQNDGEFHFTSLLEMPLVNRSA